MKSDQLIDLLRLAEKRPLTEAEQAMLRELLANEDNRIAASADQHLHTNYVATGQDRQWDPQALSQIAANIDQQTSRRSRRQRRQQYVVQFAWASVIIVGVLGFLLMRSLSTLPPIEPAAPIELTATATATPTHTPTPTLEPSPTPEPTPTLPADYRYIDLMTAPTQQLDIFPTESYSATVAEAAAQWAGDFYLPQQMPNNWSFVGATVDENNGVIELAFTQSDFGTNTLLILSQASAADRALTPPLPVAYQPLLRIDKTNDYEDRATTVGELPAHAYQYEYEYKEGGVTEWTVYNTVTWQQDEQLFTLTHVSQRLESSFTTSQMASRLRLEAVTALEE